MILSVSLACPYCRIPLRTPDLRCPNCVFQACWRDGMCYAHRGDESWEHCMIERNGWISRSQEVGVYRDNDDHYYLPDGRPHLKRVYAESKAHIDAFLKHTRLDGKVILDLGASIGWVETYILRKKPGTRLIAMDVNDDPLCGLGRSNELKKRFAVEFLSLVADMHYIPLPEESVDIVFSVDALHHFRDLEAVFAEVQRVLKPGGRFYGLNEPDRPQDTDEGVYVAKEAELEQRHRIIERRPTLMEYLASGRCLRLRAANDEVGLPQHRKTASLFLVGAKGLCR